MSSVPKFWIQSRTSSLLDSKECFDTATKPIESCRSRSPIEKIKPNVSNKLHQQYCVCSNAMRSYIESLPERLTLIEELCEYQFWKSLRTELLATFLFTIFTEGSISGSSSRERIHDDSKESFEDNLNLNINVSLKSSEVFQLKSALQIGFTAASLIQCCGHVSGCHLSIAITIGLFVSGRVSSLFLLSYLLVQCLASFGAILVVHNLFDSIIPIEPSSSLMPSQVFGFEFLSIIIIVLTYLANCDQRRTDLGFKSLSIGLAYTVAYLFAVSLEF